VLAHQNTLLLSATGSGKSLTYLVPTLVWKQARGRSTDGGAAAGACGLTLVVSPLLALIRDQLQNLPRGLEGAGLSSDMTSAEQAKVTQRLLAGQVDVLYIAPERIMSPQFIQHMTKLTDGGARPLQLVVIDEAHCTSSWAANFRPALLRLERFFRETLPVCSSCLPPRLPFRFASRHHIIRRLALLPRAHPPTTHKRRVARACLRALPAARARVRQAIL